MQTVTFIANVAAILKHGICVSMVDLVTASQFNLYAESTKFLRCSDPPLGTESQPVDAVTIRTRYDGQRRLKDAWITR